MMDLLPFPHITATEPREQLIQLKDYLYQFKEDLEFILSNLNENNLSQGLIDKLNSIGVGIDKDDDDVNDQLMQMSSNITVSDIINSTAFKMALNKKIPTFSVNFETGQLEYKGDE